MVAEPARVRRDGRVVEMPAADVVPGDLVAVGQGDRVPADVRVLRATALRTQEAALTGESAPVDKQPSPVAAGAPLAERRSVLYAGTVVAAGSGEGVAVATGTDTELGRISAMLEQADELTTPLTRELDRVGRAITLAIVRGGHRDRSGRGAARVPSRRRRAGRHQPGGRRGPRGAAGGGHDRAGHRRPADGRRRAIIRHLPAVETLGSTTVVASDKTGTLTRNQMTVQALWTPGREAPIPAPADRGPALSVDAGELLLAGVLCNDAASAAESTDGGALGDPTETALLAVAERAGLSPGDARRAHPRLAALPFDADRKLMATLHRRSDGGTVLYVKGAPEALLPRIDGSARSVAERAGRPPDRAGAARAAVRRAPGRRGRRPRPRAPRPAAARAAGHDRPAAGRGARRRRRVPARRACAC